MSFGRKLIGQMSFSQHILAMSEQIILPSIEGMRAELYKGM
jgi:hypothetical protein